MGKNPIRPTKPPPQIPPPKKVGRDTELEVMQHIATTLDELEDQLAIARVIRWLYERHVASP